MNYYDEELILAEQDDEEYNGKRLSIADLFVLVSVYSVVMACIFLLFS